MNSSDIHHCRCFKINLKDIEKCQSQLLELGFEKQPGGEEDHGQVFGLRYKLNELLQVHWKVMSDGLIESEMEPPPERPGAHLNQIHSFSSHETIEPILQSLDLRYETIHPIPDTCIDPKIIEPNSPMKWWHFLLLGLAGVAAAYIILKASK